VYKFIYLLTYISTLSAYTFRVFHALHFLSVRHANDYDTKLSLFQVTVFNGCNVGRLSVEQLVSLIPSSGDQLEPNA